jgi:putative ABC transport system permease protein
MLFGDRLKFITLVVGLTFSVMLITQQTSIFCGLMRRFVATIRNTQAAVWVMDPQMRFVDDVKPMVERELYRVRSVEGVEWAVPFFQTLSQIQLPGGKSETISMIGVDSESLIGCPRKVIAGHIEDLRIPDSIAVERRSLWKLGNPKVGDRLDINDQAARIVAIVDLAPNFQSLPYVFTTYQHALQYSGPLRKPLSFILAQPNNRYTPAALSQKIEAETHLSAYPQLQFMWKTVDYYVKNTGIPINFAITVGLGIIVGAAISAQTFYAFVMENISQFATMKAMGASNRTLILMILFQNCVVGCIGYGIGLGLMALCGVVIPAVTELSFWTPWQIPLIAYVSVVGVSLFSSTFAIRKVIQAEPALVFRG